jgi:hypothetical protein
MIYVVSGLALLSAILAFKRPTIWVMFAAGTLNFAAAWMMWGPV